MDKNEMSEQEKLHHFTPQMRDYIMKCLAWEYPPVLIHRKIRLWFRWFGEGVPEARLRKVILQRIADIKRHKKDEIEQLRQNPDKNRYDLLLILKTEYRAQLLEDLLFAVMGAERSDSKYVNDVLKILKQAFLEMKSLNSGHDVQNKSEFEKRFEEHQKLKERYEKSKSQKES